MSLDEQKRLIEQAGNLGESLPGLNLNSILENIVKQSDELKTQYEIVEQEVEENIARGESEADARKEAEEKIKQTLNAYKESIREVAIEQIAIIKQQYRIFKEGLERIPADVKLVIANIALPPAISVPPGTPNPIYALNIAKTAKSSLAGTLSIIIFAFTEILKAANKIFFVLPQSLLALYENIKTLSTVLNTIPV
jgi:predicted RNase H-like HicB family nuclease